MPPNDKKKTALVLLVSIACLVFAGCALRGNSLEVGGVKTFDGISSEYPDNARELARSAADEVARRYPPGHTAIALVSVPGDFGQTFESSLRAQGFAVVPPNESGLKLGYILDEVRGESLPVCYLQIRTSDGATFGQVRELVKMPITMPPAPYTAPASELASISLPEPSAVYQHQPEPERKLKTYTVITPGTAKRIAKRKKVPAKDFYRWNNLSPEQHLPKGYVVYLENPASGKALATTLPSSDPPQPITAQGGSLASTPPAVTALASPSVAEPVVPAPIEPYVAAPTPDMPVKASANAISPAAATPPPTEQTVALTLPTPTEQPSPLTAEVLKSARSEEWNITPGALREQISSWSARAGYQLVWKASHDFNMESHANFKGEFLDVVKSLFSGMQRSGNALRVTIYQGNKVMEVTEN